jgi:signal transduction histidine kinase
VVLDRHLMQPAMAVSADACASLRRVFVGATVGGCLLTLSACAALIVLTTQLHARVRDVTTSLDSVRIAQQMEMSLFTHRQTKDPIARSLQAANLRASLLEAERFVQSDEERHALDQLRALMPAYMAGEDGNQSAFESALTAAEELAQVNVAQARQARDRARHTDHLANVLGATVSAVLLGVVAAMLWWLRRNVFRPMLRLGKAMEEFSHGQLDARAPEEGASDMRSMAVQFNQMALSLVRTQQRQLRYIAGIVHDLRNPLAAVQLATGYVVAERPLPPEARMRDLFRMIRRQLDRLNSMVGDVLNSAAVEAGELTLCLVACEAREMATEAVELFRAMAPAHSVELEAPSEPVELRCDRVRMEHVLNNLLSNAIKYSPPGSRVRMRIERRNELVVFSVTDEGEGIAPEEREQIFQPFRRASAALAQIPGIGLGLYVSRRIVEAHGGRLTVESRLREGSTFWVILPAALSSGDKWPT